MAVSSLSLETRYHRLELTNRWLLATAAIALVALAIVGVQPLLRGPATLTANEQVAQRVSLAVNPGATPASPEVFAEDATWVGFDGTVTQGRTAIVAMPPPGVSVALDGQPVTAGPFVLVNLTWVSVGSSGGHAALLFAFDDAGLITHVTQSITFNAAARAS